MDIAKRLYAHEDQPLPESVEVPSWALDPNSGRAPTVHGLAAIMARNPLHGDTTGGWEPTSAYDSDTAIRVMTRHGAEVLEYLHGADLGSHDIITWLGAFGHTWEGWACSLTTTALDLWASDVAYDVADLLDGYGPDDPMFEGETYEWPIPAYLIEEWGWFQSKGQLPAKPGELWEPDTEVAQFRLVLTEHEARTFRDECEALGEAFLLDASDAMRATVQGWLDQIV